MSVRIPHGILLTCRGFTVWWMQKVPVPQQMLIISCLDVEVVAIGRLVSKVRTSNPTGLSSSEVAVRKPYFYFNFCNPHHLFLIYFYGVFHYLEVRLSEFTLKSETPSCIAPFISPLVWYRQYWAVSLTAVLCIHPLCIS